MPEARRHGLPPLIAFLAAQPSIALRSNVVCPEDSTLTLIVVNDNISLRQQERQKNISAVALDDGRCPCQAWSGFPPRCLFLPVRPRSPNSTAPCASACSTTCRACTPIS